MTFAPSLKRTHASTSEHPGVEEPQAGQQQHQDEVGGDEVGRLVVRHLGSGTPALDKWLQRTERTPARTSMRLRRPRPRQIAAFINMKVQ